MTETLEKVIESFIGNDPFWKDLLKEYFNKLTNISEEEKITKNTLLFEDYDKIIYVCDASSLEKNLCLLLQILQINRI